MCSESGGRHRALGEPPSGGSIYSLVETSASSLDFDLPAPLESRDPLIRSLVTRGDNANWQIQFTIL
jgi:hypothetical protein